MFQLAVGAQRHFWRADTEQPQTLPSPRHYADRSATAQELQIDVVSSATALAALGDDWNALFEHAGRPSQVFQTFGFAQTFARTYELGLDTPSAGNPCACRLAIVTARRAGRLVLVWPLVIRQHLGQRVLSWLGEPVAQYGDVLIDPAEAAFPALDAAYAHIGQALAPDVVRLRKVRTDAAIAPFLAVLNIQPTEQVEAPCVTLAAGGSSFEDRQSGKAKKNRRRLMRRLEEQGAVVFEEVAPAAAAAIVAAGLADKRDWLARRGLISPALADARVDAFLTAATGPDQLTTRAAAFTLRLDGRPIAVALGFRAKNRLMLHLITYAADVEKHGAGVLNLEAILRLAEAEGLEAVDLLPPKAEYKLDWTDTSIEVADYVWGVTPGGRLWARLIDGFAKPAAKRAIERLPLGIRRRLCARALASVRSASAP